MEREQLIELQHLLKKYTYEVVATEKGTSKEKREMCKTLIDDIVGQIEIKESLTK